MLTTFNDCSVCYKGELHILAWIIEPYEGKYPIRLRGNKERIKIVDCVLEGSKDVY